MNKPLVSVVMVVCNVEGFLAESIESILGQTFRDFEFLIVDFGSTDASKAIASTYAAKDSRIRLHEIPPCGLSEARNAACFLAQGKYIAVMDADDISLTNRLLWEVEFMERHPEVGVVGGATEWIDRTGQSVYTDHLPTGNDEIRSALTVRCAFCQPTVMIRKEAFNLVGGYRVVFAQAEDYDLWLRLADHFQLANLAAVVLKYRIHPYQVSVRGRVQQTLCFLAAQVAASSRRDGFPDPLNAVEQITPEVLAGLGVTKARQQPELISDRRKWIRHMCMTGEYSMALNAALETLQSDLEYVERWQIADLHITVAWLYWRQRRFAKSIFAAIHGMAIRPAVAGRPLKPLLRQLGLVRSMKSRCEDAR
jgi:cellulose synthase/poly-beta-1,6-N-acetylglucosamine synthase-like glycosyltransferase